jgi:hypothetical protein
VTDPLIQLEAGGIAPVLRYDIPEPTSYEGKNLIELDLGADVFSATASEMPSAEAEEKLSELPLESVKAELSGYLRTGVSSRAELPDLPIGVRPGGFASPGAETAALEETSPDNPPPAPAEDDVVDILGARLKLGYRLVMGTDLYGGHGHHPRAAGPGHTGSSPVLG